MIAYARSVAKLNPLTVCLWRTCIYGRGLGLELGEGSIYSLGQSELTAFDDRSIIVRCFSGALSSSLRLILSVQEDHIRSRSRARDTSEDPYWCSSSTKTATHEKPIYPCEQ